MQFKQVKRLQQAAASSTRIPMGLIPTMGWGKCLWSTRERRMTSTKPLGSIRAAATFSRGYRLQVGAVETG